MGHPPAPSTNRGKASHSFSFFKRHLSSSLSRILAYLLDVIGNVYELIFSVVFPQPTASDKDVVLLFESRINEPVLCFFGKLVFKNHLDLLFRRKLCQPFGNNQTAEGAPF